ncbi:MAG: DUF2070 family protein [Candidatus Thorarchaeota archaeon]
MGEKAKVKETVRLYSKVWQLPSFEGIVGRLALSVLIASTAIALLRTWSDMTSLASVLIEYIVLFGTTTFLGIGLLYLIVRQKDSPLDLRRTTGSMLFAVIFWFVLAGIGGLIDALFGIDYFEGRLTLLGMGLAYLALSFLITGLSDHHPLRNFIGSVMFPSVLMVIWTGLLNYEATIVMLPPNGILIILIMIALNSAVVVFIFRSVSRPFERDLGISGPKLLRAFGHAYLVDNPVPFESMMTGISTVQDLPLEIIKIEDVSGLYAIGVILYIHPGPFREIGSSALPYFIMNYIREKYGVLGFVLHGTCTHHQNLTTKDDYAKVIAELDRLIEQTKTNNLISGPHWSDNGKFKVWTLFSGEDALAMTTSAPEFTDDINLEVGVRTANLARSRIPSLKSVAIVDAHNCIGDDAVSLMPDDPDAEEYAGAVASALFGTLNLVRGEVSAGVYQFRPNNISIEEGMGPGGITALVINSVEGESVLISVDGNNVEPGFREKVISLLKGQGYKHVEIATTDTHVVNAVSMSSKGYPPVGRMKAIEILESIGVAAAKARETTRQVSVGLGFGEIKGLRTFGEKGFDTLTQDIAESASIAKHTGLRAAGGTALMSLLLALLL